jgi:hypothetical protein
MLKKIISDSTRHVGWQFDQFNTTGQTKLEKPEKLLEEPIKIKLRFDTTGQIAPRGSKPHVTITAWEEEGTSCFGVRGNGIWVPRRSDNRMINGTRLLIAAGVPRAHADDILNCELVQHFVQLGSALIKGHW